jgi:hypothetical protein
MAASDAAASASLPARPPFRKISANLPLPGKREIVVV